MGSCRPCKNIRPYSRGREKHSGLNVTCVLWDTPLVVMRVYTGGNGSKTGDRKMGDKRSLN